MQRISRFFLIFSLLFLVGGGLLCVSHTQASGNLFTRPLRLGLFGEDVRELQKILNTDPSTRIQESGLGSPGQETAYFGALTSAAVVRFQEKYRKEILVPNGLSAGTGFVGVSTLAMLNKFVQGVGSTTKSPVNISGSMNTSPNSVTQTNISSQSNITIENPNQKNLDAVLEAIDRVGRKQGLSKEKLALAKKVVIDESATTTDLKEKFLEVVKGAISVAPQPVQNVFADFIKPFKEMIYPKRAVAAMGTPFGGALLFSMYCTETENWWIGVQPLAPSYAALLTYETGSQVYLGYNIPITTELLGEYQQGSPCIQGICPYCVTMPSEGMISPKTGSSPI